MAIEVKACNAGIFTFLELVPTPSACRSALQPQSSTKQEQKLFAVLLRKHQPRRQVFYPQQLRPWPAHR